MFYTRLSFNLQPKTLPLLSHTSAKLWRWVFIYLTGRLFGGLSGRRLIALPVLVFGAVTVMAIGAGIAAASGSDIKAPVQSPVPPMTTSLVDGAGNEFDLSGFAGQPLLVNFWAKWCAPCVVELPALTRMGAELANDGVGVLLISIDRGGAAKAIPFLEKTAGASVTGVEIEDVVHLGFDPKARLSREMSVKGLPTSFLIDSTQTKSWRFVGPFEWDSPEMLALMRGLLTQ